MYRRETNKAADSRFFSATANKTKSINITPKIMRGGTRL